jgi:hypothetical protein
MVYGLGNVPVIELTLEGKLAGERNPVPREMSGYAKLLWISEWPAPPFIEVRRGERNEEDDNESGEAELEPLIRIRRANFTPCPKPPEVLDGWLKPGWQSVETEAQVLASRYFPDEENGRITVAFEKNGRRVTPGDSDRYGQHIREDRH